MRSFWNDLTFGVRTQLQTPVTTAAVIATLAFGIAANVVAFALIDSFFLRPLPVSQPERLVRIYSSSPGGMQYFTVSYGDYADIRGLTDVFERVVVEEPVPLTLGIAGSYQRVWGARVSHDYFDMLGVAPASGRFFTQQEEAPGAAPVAVIGHGLWHREFGGRDVIGDTMTVEGQRVTIVGIVDERFHGTTIGVFPDLWLPAIGDPETVLARGGGRFFVLGRLQPGRSVAEANAALDLLAHRLERTYATNRGVRFPVLQESHGRVHPSARGGFLGVSGVFVVVAILVLILACTNVASILLARGLSRRAEIAVRLALGATRGRIVRQLLIESCSVAAVAGITGVALAWMAMDVLSTMPLPTARGAPIGFGIGIDARILSFSALVAAVTTILFGLAPALTASRGELVPALKNEAAGAGLRSTQVRDVLIAVQVALSIVLLIGGGLFVRSLQHALRIDPGFDPDDVVVASVDLTPRGDAGAPPQFWRRLVDHLAALPHARAATLADRVPFEFNITVMSVAPEGGEPSTDDASSPINYAIVDEGYFETLRIPLLEGREFSRRDGASAPAVVVVNDVLARRFWPGTSAIGRRLVARDGTSYEVVGVARSVKYLSLGEEPTPYIYRPLAQTGPSTMTLIVRTAADPMSLMRELRPAVRAVNDTVAVYNIETMTDRMRLAYLPATSGATVLTLMSIVALLLTGVGLYGTVDYVVGRRTHEIGIRRALGAQQAGITWLVVRRVTLFAVAGLAVGAAAGLIGSRALRALLYDVDPFDRLVIALAPVVMVSVCMIAASVPAWRAARIDPAVALRRE